MPLFTSKARPRLTRSATSIKRKEREMYMYLYFLALVVLLVVSITVVQLYLGGTSDHAAEDSEHRRKGASGAESLRGRLQEAESRSSLVRRDNYNEAMDANRKKLAEIFHLSNRWKTRRAGKKGERSRRVVGGKGESKGQGLQYLSNLDVREINSNDQDKEEFDSGSADEELNEIQAYKSRMYQGQQLDDMDKFGLDEGTEGEYKRQGQPLEDMDKFDNHQVGKFGTVKQQFKEDAGPKFMQKLSESRGFERKRKYQRVGQNRAEVQADESSLVIKGDVRGHLQDGRKGSRKLGFGVDSGRDVLNQEREGDEQERNETVVGSVAGQWASENRSLSADTIKLTYEAAKGSIRAAIEQEMEKRNGTFLRDDFLEVRKRSRDQAGGSGRLNFGGTNPDPILSSVEDSAKEASLEKSAETGIPPLRGFKEFSDNINLSSDNQRRPIDVVQMDVKSTDAEIFDQGRSQARRLDPWGVLKGEADVVDSLIVPNVTENTVDIMLSSRSAQVAPDVRNLDSANALAMSKQFDRNENNVEVSQSENHLKIADVLQSDKKLMEEDHVHSVKDIPGDEEELKSRKINEEDSAVEEKEDDDHDNSIHWGFYPTLSSNLKFSKFLTAFFKQESCSLRIFMAWTTAPWAYTPRHQRSIESILHFHPQACIVVFTETIDFKFFESWVKDGYKIAVARPNLEELLGHTPAIDFAYVWYEWRSMNLFYIHYTELLRIAALHKYGGVWLDMDMILARPLPQLHNVLGSTVSDSGEWVLNGAFMSFEKSSSFLKACIEEFVATYDETLLGWNGAELLNRVASNATRKGGKEWLEQSEHLQVLEPIAFFPLSRHNILSYLSAPKDNNEKAQQVKMLSTIMSESFGTHLWNSVTGRRVPEVGSLVEKLLNRNCMRCTDVL